MQPSKDNLTNENPYSPPKSADFRQPENNYQPIKGQRIRHILLGALSFSFLSSTLMTITTAINMFFDGDELQIIYFIPIFIIMFLIAFIVGIVFSIYNEYHIKKIKNKYIYSLVCGFVIYISLTLTVGFCVFFFVVDSFSLDKFLYAFLYALINTFSKTKQQIFAFEGIIILAISIFITIRILDRHRNYLYNKYFSGSLK